MIRRKRSPDDEQGPAVAAWIVSFSDMITLLLSFFVLLQAFAEYRDPELFFQGQGSFLRAIRCFGLPEWLLGVRDQFEQDHRKVKSPAEEADNKVPRNRLIDDEDEKIREAFRDLRRVVDAESSDLTGLAVETTASPVRFRSGQAELDEAARKWLRGFAREVRQTRHPEGTRIRVLAAAPDLRQGKQRWVLAARRARCVADYVRSALSAGAAEDWSVVSCGATPDTKLWRGLGGTADRSYVLIAIEGKEQRNGR
jgi:flagellar motor protein MotB